MNWYKFFGLSMAIMAAGNAVGAVVIASDYVSAGISTGIGIFWIIHLESRERG